MTPPFYIALRFLSHRKRALLLSLSGVVFGVAFFICLQAQTHGFAVYFINSTLGSNGALRVGSRFEPRQTSSIVPPKTSRSNVAHRQYFEGITNVGEIMRVSRQFSNVVACSPILRGTLSARSGFENATVDLYGIEPALHLQTTDLSHQIVDGSLDDFRNKPNSVVVGSGLADLLNLEVGDTVQLLAPGGQYRRFLVAATAQSGVGSIDSTRMYCHARVAQVLLRKPYAASMIIYKLRDIDRAPALARHFETLFQHDAASWQEREESTLQLFRTLQISAAITVSLVILLAGLQGIPQELYEAARIDGASAPRQFRYITLPMLAPIIAMVSILTIAGYFQLFAEPYVMTQGGPLQSTVSVLYFMYEEGFKWWNLGSASAVAFILFLFIFAVTVVQVRFARRGLAS